MSAAKREHERRRDKDPRRRFERKNKVAEQFIAHSREMRESIAFRSLPITALRVLLRVELEHMRHAGAENGRLIVTYKDFVDYGINRGGIALAIRQCCELGFLEVTLHGGRSLSDQRWPNRFRLTQRVRQ